MPTKSIRLATSIILVSLVWWQSLLADSFTSPLFESLSRSALEAEAQRLSALESPTPADRVKQLQTELFLAERMGYDGEIHLQNETWDGLVARCQKARSNGLSQFGEKALKSQAAFSCAIACSEKLTRVGRFGKNRYLALVSYFLNFADKQDPSKFDRHYAQGRIYYKLPSTAGPRVGKSLLAFQFLRRLRPAATSSDFWLGRIYQRQGNERRAREAFNRALQKGDARAKLFFKSERYYRNPEHLDGHAWGIQPSLYNSPVGGFGGNLHLFDDKMFDTHRAGRLSLGGSTRGQYGATLSYTDRALLPETAILFGLQFGRNIKEFYGLGINSLKTNFSRLEVQQFYGHLGFQKQFLNYFFLTVYWKFGADNVMEQSGTSFASASLRQKDQSFHTGVSAEFGFDNRDSHRAPRKGYRVWVEGYFPNDTWGSETSFQEYHFEAQGYYSLGRKHSLGARLGTHWVSGDPPYAVFSALGRSFQMPGVRTGRFQERAALGAVSEYRFQISNTFSLLAFGNLGTVASTFSNLFSSSLKAGGGAGVIMHPTHYHAPSVRIEVGMFASEFIFSAGGGVSF